MSRVEQQQEQRRVELLKQERTQQEAEKNAAQFQQKLSAQKQAQAQPGKTKAPPAPTQTPPKTPTPQRAKMAPPLKQQVKEQAKQKNTRNADEKTAKQEHQHEMAVLHQAIKKSEDQESQDSADKQPSDEFFDWTASVATSGLVPTSGPQAPAAPTRIPDEVYQSIVQHAYVHNAGKGQSPAVVLELNEDVFGSGANVNISTDGKGGVSIHFSGLKNGDMKRMVGGSREELQKRLFDKGMSLKNLSMD